MRNSFSISGAPRAPEKRFRALDGWRGISILLILAAHLLPLVPKRLHLNHTAAAMGMALFLTDVTAHLWSLCVEMQFYIGIALLSHSWLGSGDTLVRYAKRRLLFLLLFVLAHISTVYYERHWILFGKRLSNAYTGKELVALK